MIVTFKPRIVDGDSIGDPGAFRVKEDIRITEPVAKITMLFDQMRSTLPMIEIKPMEDHIAETYLKPALQEALYPEQRYDQVTLCFQPKKVSEGIMEISVRSSEEAEKDAKTFPISDSPEVDKLFGPSALEWSATFGVPVFRTYHLDI